MGEDAVRIHIVGAPGLVGLRALATRSRTEVAATYGLQTGRAIALVLYHPVVQDATQAGREMAALLGAVRARGLQALCLMPNADFGNSAIRDAINASCDEGPDFRAVTHLARADYVSLLAVADVLVGNSSSGIVEAAAFGTPVVNVGDRQALRERNANVVDCSTDGSAIENAIGRALVQPRESGQNIYGDGQTHLRVAAQLSSLDIGPRLLKKTMTY
jgi:GDP/UDP-N,N'-diacetylbacillosamine 2-epimerase (hydrolysing)